MGKPNRAEAIDAPALDLTAADLARDVLVGAAAAPIANAAGPGTATATPGSVAPIEAAPAEAEQVAPPPIGERLRAARLARGLTLVDVHNGTKVKIAHLEAIELGEAGTLPATPFAAGFVKAFAQFVGLDAEASAAAFRAERAPKPAVEIAPTPQKPAPQPAPAKRPQFVAAPALQPPFPTLARALRAAAAHPAPVAADAAAPSLARAALRPEHAVTAIGIGASVALALWLAISVMTPRRESLAAAPESRVEAALSAPAAIATEAPAEPAAEVPAAIEPAKRGAEIAEGVPSPEQSPPAPSRDAVLQEETQATASAQSGLDAAAQIAANARDQNATGADTRATDAADAARVVRAAPAPRLAPKKAAPRSRVLSGGPEADVSTNAAPAGPQTAPNGGEARAETEMRAAATATGEMRAARVLSAPAAVYPERCAGRAAPRETVTIALDVGADGAPRNLRIAATENACFNGAAMAAAARMRFAPALLGAQAVVEPDRRVTIEFRR